jgi:hypothetical protein
MSRKLTEDDLRKMKSTWLKSDDIPEPEGLRGVKVTRAENHHFEGMAGKPAQDKPVLFFDEDRIKPWILGPTMRDKMVKCFGTNPDLWIGQELDLYVEETPLGPGIRFTPSRQPAPLPQSRLPF